MENNDINYIMISPNFPNTYYRFAKALHERGINVLGIGDAYQYEIKPELKENLKDYIQVYNLNNLHDMIEGVQYYFKKYNHIEWLESNNEYWLENDSTLREWFNIKSGIYHSDILKYKAKSEMKKYFESAGISCAKYCLSDDYNKVVEFAKQVGYPIFVKPNIGVGAAGTKKIKNIDELNDFYKEKDEHQYIFEQYIDGSIYSFDGITNSKGEIIYCCSHRFLEVIDKVVHELDDDAYYTYKEIPEKINKLGHNIVKAFDLHSRCFHIELFKLNKDHPGLGKKDDFVALEVNMRPVGGYTPDLISIAANASFYDMYADMIAYDENRQDMSKYKYFAISVSRRDNFNYVKTEEEINEIYKDHIVNSGKYPKSISDAMGDYFVMAKFDTEEEVLEFQRVVREKY